MLSVSPAKRAADAIDYFHQHLGTTLGAEKGAATHTTESTPGRWLGGGADTMGLEEAVEPLVLATALMGFSPDRRPLVRNAGDPARRAGWDLVLSAPKSVSVLWAIGAPEISHALLDAHQQAAQATFEAIESRGWVTTRRGAGGHERLSGRMVMAGFGHCVSRELDPQLHTHGLILSLVQAGDGSWGSLEPRSIFRHQLDIGAIYRQELERRIQAIGIETEPDGFAFRLPAMPRELEQIFSCRRQAIVARLAELGRTGPKAAELAALETRPAKRHVGIDTLRGEWAVRAAHAMERAVPAEAWDDLATDNSMDGTEISEPTPGP